MFPRVTERRTGRELEASHPLVEGIHHRSHIIQIPRLASRRRDELERLLAIFATLPRRLGSAAEGAAGPGAGVSGLVGRGHAAVTVAQAAGHRPEGRFQAVAAAARPSAAGWGLPGPAMPARGLPGRKLPRRRRGCGRPSRSDIRPPPPWPPRRTPRQAQPHSRGSGGYRRHRLFRPPRPQSRPASVRPSVARAG